MYERRRIKDFDTGEYFYQSGEGFFDSITNLLGKAAIKTASVGSKVVASKSTQKLGKIAAEKIGQKAAEEVMNKIAPGPLKRLENKGDLIIKELQKLQPKENKIPDKVVSSSSSINEEFNKIINI